jgi:Fe-S cluster biogenesis protein NfuA
MPTHPNADAPERESNMSATTSTEADVLMAIDAIRPALQADGGDIVFKEIDGDAVVHVELVGACGTCPVSTMTLKAGVERIIKDRVPAIAAVVADNVDTDAEFA